MNPVVGVAYGLGTKNEPSAIAVRANGEVYQLRQILGKTPKWKRLPDVPEAESEPRGIPQPAMIPARPPLGTD